MLYNLERIQSSQVKSSHSQPTKPMNESCRRHHHHNAKNIQFFSCRSTHPYILHLFRILNLIDSFHVMSSQVMFAWFQSVPFRSVQLQFDYVYQYKFYDSFLFPNKYQRRALLYDTNFNFELSLVPLSPSSRHSTTKRTRFNPRIAIFTLSKTERNILVLIHVLNLSLHGHEKKYSKVHYQNWPKDGNIKNPKKGHEKRNQSSPKASQPEFEFWQSSRERFVFLAFTLGGWEWGSIVTS